jgi:RimJ/RimL family protein N-acetyltransferase
LNFHAAPDASGQVEIGYTLLPEARGQGYGIEAVRAMFDWARQAHGVHRFRASVAPDNERSLNLIGKLGFVHTGEQWDPDDGLELVYELEDAPA